MYTIQFLGELSTFTQQTFIRTLQETIAQDGRFCIGKQHWGISTLTRKECREAGVDLRQELGRARGAVDTMYLQRIRLTHKRPYCGQHAGECQVNPFTGALPRKPNSTCLEYSDWVDFHAVINGVLDYLQMSANVWTTPMEGGVRKMWIRKGLSPRVRWDYTTEYDNYGRANHTWNAGTPDQFVA